MFDLGRVGRQAPAKGHALTDPGIYTSPTLDIDFTSGVLDSRITFTRAAGPASYFDVNGVLQNAGTNVARFDYDPVTHAPRGLLIEEARTNQCFPSIPDNTGWTTTNGITTLNQTIAPDGTNSATLFIDNNTSNAHQNVTNGSFAYVAGTAYTFSIYAKAATASGLQIFAGSAPWDASTYANFDLNAGVVGTRNGNAASSSIQAVGNGWYRCSFTTTALSSASTVYFAICLTNNNNSAGRGTIYVGTGTGVYIWGAQTEAGAFPTSYIPTSGATATRPAETAVIPPVPTPNGAVCSIEVEAMTPYLPGKSVTLLALTDGVNKDTLFINASNIPAMFSSTGLNQTLGAAIATGVVNKIAGAFANAAQRGAYNGTTIATAVATVPQTATSIYVGSDSGGSQSNSWIRHIRDYNQILSDAQLRQLTT